MPPASNQNDARKREEEVDVPGEFHGLYSPWSHKELDKNEPLSLPSFFNWMIIALQCCVGFSHTTMRISHK